MIPTIGLDQLAYAYHRPNVYSIMLSAQHRRYSLFESTAKISNIFFQPPLLAQRKSRGLATKIHLMVDTLGNPLAFFLTGGQAHDLEGADALLPR
jgi:hypothetical protein